MKSIISFIVLSSLLCLSGFAEEPLATGETFCCLGTYAVDISDDPIMVDGKALPTYLVTYENSDLTIRIGVDKSVKKCTRYLVVTDDLAIQYDCNSKYFGTNLIDKEYRDDGLVTTDYALDKEAYFRQKILSQSRLSRLDQLKLISVYFPKLVKEYEDFFAVRDHYILTE